MYKKGGLQIVVHSDVGYLKEKMQVAMPATIIFSPIIAQTSPQWSNIGYHPDFKSSDVISGRGRAGSGIHQYKRGSHLTNNLN